MIIMPIKYCDDWQCPAMASCAHHFWRSPEYAGMHHAETEKFPRDPLKDSCSEYEFDKPKDWLMPRIVGAQRGHPTIP